MRLAPGTRLVIASHNEGKVREIRALLEPRGYAVLPAAELGLPEPLETESSFAGNARIKAHAAASGSGLPALADDSGIMVEALGGAPGVYTADWATTPEGRDYGMAMRQVWEKLEAQGAPEPRRAAFHCTLCLALPDGTDALFEGEVAGRLVWPPRGGRGFGFDPMFLPEGGSETYGEMDPAEKHATSHRSKAFAQFVDACIG